MPTCLDFFANPVFAFILVLVAFELSSLYLNFVTYPKIVLDPIFLTDQKIAFILILFAIEMVTQE